MIAAFISALAASTNLVTDKLLLSRHRISLRVFLPIIFIFLFVFTAILTPSFGTVNWDVALLSNSMFLVFLMIVIAIAWNVLFYQSVQAEKVHEHEVVVMMAPLFTILLAAAFFPEEFELRIFILTLISSLALFFAKAEKAHITTSITSYNLILGVVLMATENVIVRELLYTYSPVALYAIRTLFLAGFFMIYYRPRYAQVSARHWWWIAGSAVLGVVEMLGKFYAFSTVGIVYTTLITMLAPLVIFLASWELLHEKIKPRVLIAFVVIMVCVIIATFIKF